MFNTILEFLIEFLTFLIEFFKWVITLGVLFLVPVVFFKGIKWIYGETESFILKILGKSE